MILHQGSSYARLAAIVTIAWLPSTALATPIIGAVVSTSPSGQVLALSMKIDDSTTTFELTGPGYSWFSFGFDTVSMEGYSLIIEGTNDSRSAVEQNLLGTGNPGRPQLTQDIRILSTNYDSVTDLTKIVIERANDTGDVNDPVFKTSMTSLQLIWAYRAPASQVSPSPTLNNHGIGGRGFDTITFLPVPEPTSMATSTLSFMITLWFTKHRRRNSSTG